MTKLLRSNWKKNPAHVYSLNVAFKKCKLENSPQTFEILLIPTCNTLKIILWYIEKYKKKQQIIDISSSSFVLYFHTTSLIYLKAGSGV